MCILYTIKIVYHYLSNTYLSLCYTEYSNMLNVHNTYHFSSDRTFVAATWTCTMLCITQQIKQQNSGGETSKQQT